MKLFPKKYMKALAVMLIMFALVGCSRVTDTEGKTLAEKIIYLSTPWKDMFANENWFTALFVYPIAQLINYLAPKTGVVVAILLTTIVVNLVILPLSFKSTAGTQKMQMVQPELDKIQKKYEGKDDERSRMMMSQEMNNLYKKYDIHPFATILGTLVTFPVIIAMYQAVQRAEAVVNGTFMGVDLQLSPRNSIQEGSHTMAVCFVIFIIMAVLQYLTVNLPKWLAEKQNKKDHKIRDYNKTESSQQQQTKSMNITMLVMIIFMGFTLPTTMSVYWAVNSLVNIVKTLLIQKMVVEKGQN